MGIRELKQNASKVIQEVKDGEVITVTEHGVPVAKIIPIANDRYLELIQEGTIQPGTGVMDLSAIKPVKLPEGMTIEQILRNSRGKY